MDWIRKYKFVYSFYNLLYYSKLKQNLPKYKMLNLRKFYFSPVSSKDFIGKDPQILKSSRRDIPFQQLSILKKLSADSIQSLQDFQQKGFAVLSNYLSPEQVNQINADVQQLVEKGDAKFRYNNRKLMFLFRKLDSIKAVGENPDLIELLSYLLKGEAHLFQSINFIKGSEQKTHSDSIHMTTFPLGGLLGVWIALEDITLDNGPLHYYPESHKLPYYLNAAYQNEGSFWKVGAKNYDAYEVFMEGKIKELKLEKQVFQAKAGDVLIWHANLFHGGEPQLDTHLTRKSLVMHYYNTDCICYHELTQRPALL